MTGRIPRERLTRFGSAILQRLGVGADDGDLVARILIDAEERGNASHGLAHLLLYAKRLQEGVTRPDAAVETVADAGAIVVLDANFGLGQIAASHATEMAAQRAKTHGIALIAVRNNTTFGACAWYAERLVEAGHVCVIFSNSGPIMAPWGGKLPLIGNSPFAMGVPTAEHGPLVLDMACSVTARGNIVLAAERGEEIAPGLALDAEGQPTTDAAFALLGSVLPFGAYKGYGLALMIEMMSGILAGAEMVTADMPPGGYERAAGRAQTFIAVDIERLMPLTEFMARSSKVVRQILSSPPAPGHSEILVPGMRSLRTRERTRAEGLTVHADTLSKLEKLGKTLGVTL